MSEADKERIADVTWETPPPEQRNRYDWDAIAAQLRAKPGEWAKVFEGGRVSVSNAVRQGKIRVVAPSRGFEVRTRDNTRTRPRQCSLYMRYMPDKDMDQKAVE